MYLGTLQAATEAWQQVVFCKMAIFKEQDWQDRLCPSQVLSAFRLSSYYFHFCTACSQLLWDLGPLQSPRYDCPGESCPGGVLKWSQMCVALFGMGVRFGCRHCLWCSGDADKMWYVSMFWEPGAWFWRLKELGCTVELRLLQAGRWMGIIQGFLTLTAGWELGDLLGNVIRENPGSLGIIKNKVLNPEYPINTQCVFKSIKV